MELAIKCIYNLPPPHLSYDSTLPDITKKMKRDIDELKHWHLVDRILQGIIDKAIGHLPVANTAACMCKAKGRHFEHLLWSRHTAGSFQSHLLIRRQYQFSVFV